MTDVLGKLFGGVARVKLLRLFLLNPDTSFSAVEIASRTRIPSNTIRKEVALLLSAGFIVRVAGRKRGKRHLGCMLNARFSHLVALRNLLTNAPMQTEEVKARLRGVGAVRLIVIAGVFVGNFDGGLDLLVVGDRVNQAKLTAAVRGLEASVGKELQYAHLTHADFLYRLGINDRLTRDVFDYRHEVVLDKLSINLPS